MSGSVQGCGFRFKAPHFPAQQPHMGTFRTGTPRAYGVHSALYEVQKCTIHETLTIRLEPSVWACVLACLFLRFLLPYGRIG